MKRASSGRATLDSALGHRGIVELRTLFLNYVFGTAAKERTMDHKIKGIADKANGTDKDIRGKQPEPDFDKPLGSSHNDEADLRDVAQEAAKKSK